MDNHRRGLSTPHAIPLQDLNDPSPQHDGSGQGLHRRTLSDRGRELFQTSRNSRLQRDQHGIGYAPLRGGAADAQRSATDRGIGLGLNLDTRTHDETTPRHSDDHDSFSPIGPGLQEAVGFSGLSYDPVELQGGGIYSTPTAQGRRARPIDLPTLRTIPPDDDEGSHDARSVIIDEEFGDGTGAFPSETDADTTPLTGSSRLVAHSSQPSTPTGQRHDRMSSFARHTRFLSTSQASHGTSDPELGSAGSRRHRSHSHTPTSPIEGPLRRAGTVMQRISQRVVNVTNEPEVVEKDIKRRHSLRGASNSPTTTRHSGPHQHDGSNSPRPSEKGPPPVQESAYPELPHRQVYGTNNPLRGKSLGIIGPDNFLRKALLNFLTYRFVEPIILVLIVLQTVLLTFDARRNVVFDPRSKRWGTTWVDFAMLGLFVVYTLEVLAKIIISGLIVNPIEYSTIDRQISLRQAVSNKVQDMFAVHRKPSTAPPPGANLLVPQPLLRSFTVQDMGDARENQRSAAKKFLARRAYLRHSFNRLDLIAVGAYWIAFFIAVTGVEAGQHLYVFKMLSCLRILRLLQTTAGMSVILRSLKRAMPILLNVAFLICFFWLLFGIIGIQSFKSSLRRTCVWSDPDKIWPDYAQNGGPDDFQFCGGWIHPNGTAMPYYRRDGTLAANARAKGYWCPVNSTCVEGANPYNGTVSFDNLPQSLQLVFVIMTTNTWSDVMYYLTDSDYLIVALFFALGIIILSLWMVNLLIAVITSSFQIIREESKASAFAAEQRDEAPVTPEGDAAAPLPRKSALARLLNKTRLFWIAIIVFGLVAQAFRSASMGPGRATFVTLAELVVTFMLDIEILLRLVANFRTFFKSKQNMFDLFLAVITTVVQIPAIRNAEKAYAWLTLFQLLRAYRVVLSVRFLRDLIFIVLGNFNGLANLILFVFLLTYLAALFATQLFRGELPFVDDQGNALHVSFFTIWNSFLGMYQILSSENWTSIMYDVTTFQTAFNNAWIGAGFCILWYILANFVVLNMFIAVIQENFDVSEDEKRLQQVKSFLSQKRFMGPSGGILSLSSLFKFGNTRRQDPLDFGSAATEMLLKDAVVNDFLDDPAEGPTTAQTPGSFRGSAMFKPDTIKVQGLTIIERIKLRLFNSTPNPFHSRLQLQSATRDVDPRVMAKEVVQAAEQRKQAQREYLRTHPNYNTTLLIFRPGHPVRRFCQRIVAPGRGEDRFQGSMPSVPVWYAFSAFIYAAIVAMVLLACVTTPLYQKRFFATHGFSSHNWFVWTDLGFASLFTAEALIKVIADGFFWTPNAYFRGSWGAIDGVVLITLWINVIALLYDPGTSSRTVGAFKALRALRLLSISDNARETFHSVIVTGGWKIVSAAFVSLSLLIPFAIYGLNLFNGQMQSCNDSSDAIYNLTDCVGEYMSSPNNWNVLAPRVVGNSYYSFDDFGGALFILFQIVSQEGWTDVMWSGQSITGVFTSPAAFASQGNAVFFVIFNLLGAVFVLTLFVSVFMRNYTEQTGVAFLTTEQRSWLELRKLLRQVAPSKRPSTRKRKESWQEWCYKRAVKKQGKWHRTVTAMLVLHLVLLCLEWYPDESSWLLVRDYLFLALTMVFVANVVIRIVGLSWSRFRRSAWDIYSAMAVSGTLVSTILQLVDPRKREYAQVHKLFLVALALLLIPRNNQLDQLFKTAAASFTAIGNLLATWFVLFLVFAIALNQTFGLTRFGSNESSNINVRTVPKALIMLFRTSVGEGWNQLMNDFASIEPPYCTIGARYFDGDCGSASWAFALYILWNILSMYIFVNLFVSLIYESFSYVYQRSSGHSVISREEIRRFKQAWSEHDPEGKGYISKEAFPRLLGELSGVFEMRIYDGDFTVKALLEVCRLDTHRFTASSADGLFPPGAAPGPMMSPGMDNLVAPSKAALPGVDLEKLNERLADLPVDEIRKRRSRMNTFYEEVLVSADPDKGIEFSSLLMILAHYKVINDNRSLRLEEFLRRRARLQRVEEAVRRNVVVGFFDTLYWTRKFRRRIEGRKHARMTAVPAHDFAVPEIFVHDASDDPQVLAERNLGPMTPVVPSSGGASFDGAATSAPSTPGTWSDRATVGQRSLHSSPSTPARQGAYRARADSTLSPSASPSAAAARRQRSNTMASSNGSSDLSEGIDRRSWFLTAALTAPFDSLPSDPYSGPLEPLTNSHSRTASAASPGGGPATIVPTITTSGWASHAHSRNPSSSGPSAHPDYSVSASLSPGSATGHPGGSQRAAAGGRQRSNTSVSRRDMMDDLDNSAWGESIRRSFTVARRPTVGAVGGWSRSVSGEDASAAAAPAATTTAAGIGAGPSSGASGGPRSRQGSNAGLGLGLGFGRGGGSRRGSADERREGGDGGPYARLD